MYLSHFGLTQPPFSITPNPAFFYTGNQRGEILDALLYAVTHGEGIVKVTGEVGSGKTMLCRMLESLLPANVEAIYLVNPTLGREEVVYAIASELGLATGGKRADEVIRMLQSDLIAKHVAGKQVVLLVEEAQAMPLETLEEIRLFSNLETAQHKLLQIVLFGQPELDESLNLPRMRQLKERITHSFKMPPLERERIPEYLMFRMRAAGYRGPDVFTKSAIKRIAAVSQGIVRRISILADKSLLAAFADNTHLVQARHVKAAIEDSEFSPAVKKRRRRFAVAAAAIAVCAVVAGALGWQLWQRSADHPKTRAVAVTPSRPATAQTAAPASITAPLPAAAMPTSIPAIAPLQQRLTASRAWLVGSPGLHYAVQFLTLDASDPKEAEQRLLANEQALGAERVRIFPSRLNGKAQFVLIYGDFGNRPDAVEARSALSRNPLFRPRLRTVNGMLDEIRRTQADDLWPK